MSKSVSLKLVVPDYMTIQSYAEMNSYQGQSKVGKLVHTVSALTGHEKDYIRKWDIQSLIKVANVYANIADHKQHFHPLVEWKGKLYGFASIKNANLGEYIDLELLCKDLEQNMHKVAAILYRPVTKHRFNDIVFNIKQGIKVAKNKVDNPFDWYDIEEYDNTKRKQVEEDFKDFPVHLFLGALSFFLSTGSLYLNNTAYLEKTLTKKQMKEIEKEIMESLSHNIGDGGVHYTTSLKPLYYQSLETNV